MLAEKRTTNGQHKIVSLLAVQAWSILPSKLTIGIRAARYAAQPVVGCMGCQFIVDPMLGLKLGDCPKTTSPKGLVQTLE